MKKQQGKGTSFYALLTDEEKRKVSDSIMANSTFGIIPFEDFPTDVLKVDTMNNE